MALVQVQKNGTTMTVDSNNLSIWLGAGWTQVGGGTSTPTPSQPTQVQPQPSSGSSGWVDPANGQPTPYGVGIPAGNYRGTPPPTGSTAQTIQPTGQEIRNSGGYTLQETLNLWQRAKQAKAAGETQFSGVPIDHWMGESGQGVALLNDFNLNYGFNFKPGLSVDQKLSILNLLATHPPSTWNAADRANWNYATNNALPPSLPSSSYSQGGTSASTSTGGIQSTGNAQLDALLQQMQGYLNNLTQSGKTVNPNIELSPDKVQEFLNQATNEISPYYSSQLQSLKGDLSANLQSLQKQYDLQKQSSEAQLKNELATSREQAAGAGTIFSGGRGAAEQNYIAGTNRQLSLNAQNAADAARRLLSGGEQQLGTRNVSDLLGQGRFGQYSATAEGSGSFTPTGSYSSYTSPGNVTGSLEREQLTATRQRQSELEQAERARRALNFYS